MVLYFCVSFFFFPYFTLSSIPCGTLSRLPFFYVAPFLCYITFMLDFYHHFYYIFSSCSLPYCILFMLHYILYFLFIYLFFFDVGRFSGFPFLMFLHIVLFSCRTIFCTFLMWHCVHVPMFHIALSSHLTFFRLYTFMVQFLLLHVSIHVSLFHVEFFHIAFFHNVFFLGDLNFFLKYSQIELHLAYKLNNTIT